MESNKIECKRDHKDLRLYINGALHLQITMDNHDSVQSWFKGSGRNFKTYFVEFTRRTGEAVTLEYDDEKIWREVLALLDNNL